MYWISFLIAPSFSFIYFLMYHAACRILFPWPLLPSVEAWSLNHWTTRVVLVSAFFHGSVVSQKWKTWQLAQSSGLWDSRKKITALRERFLVLKHILEPMTFQMELPPQAQGPLGSKSSSSWRQPLYKTKKTSISEYIFWVETDCFIGNSLQTCSCWLECNH